MSDRSAPPPSLLRALQSLDVKFTQVAPSALATALAELNAATLTISVFDDELPTSTIGDLMTNWDSTGLKALSTTSSTKSSLFDLLNKFEIFHVFESGAREEQHRQDLFRAFAHLQQEKSHRLLLQEFKQQNRKLETFTKSLEDAVAERTKDIQTSKNQVEVKVRKVKQLVAFIKTYRQ
jgi:hypothetical protein